MSLVGFRAVLCSTLSASIQPDTSCRVLSSKLMALVCSFRIRSIWASPSLAKGRLLSNAFAYTQTDMFTAAPGCRFTAWLVAGSS